MPSAASGRASDHVRREVTRTRPMASRAKVAVDGSPASGSGGPVTGTTIRSTTSTSNSAVRGSPPAIGTWRA
ncbi:hypothetical protein ACFVGY_19690 [Streptomyces sp. NPDC127106]|uniref:hypothetical protein n=1 Tax=Streptomyces sp. NPDC127106 TaxID=3345360 RepID=UPI0036262813